MTWLPIPGYESHYEVSDTGRVRSLRSGQHVRPAPRPVKPGDNGQGHLHVNLWLDGKPTKRYVHQLVLEAFVGPCPDGMEVLHGNGDASDNRRENLRYGTSQENRMDAVRHGTHNMSSKTHCKRGHEFTVENTALVKLASGSIGRRCRACDAEKARLRKAMVVE